MRVAFYTLGCKVNQYETDLLINEFLKNGFTLVDYSEEADVYVINSCTVTAHSDKKTRQMITRFKRLNDKAKIILTGCFSQAFPKKAELINGVDIITGTNNKKNILKLLNENILTNRKIVQILAHKKDDTFEKSKVKNPTHTRAFVKIQDGCNRYCSYCIIPYARGFSRSKPIDELREEIKSLSDNCYKEIVLVGINLSSYGVDINSNILEAINTVSEFDNIKRIRLGSLEPELLTKDVIKALSENEKFCPHFHISLQSGCDETLKRMNRHYNTSEYEEIVTNIRKYFINSSITTDVMVGFSGETDEEFEKSLNFCKKIKFSKIHIFPYSKREGTRAYEFNDHIKDDIKSNRVKVMQQMEQALSTEFLNSNVGTVSEVLFESTVTKDGQEGSTKNYTTVYVKSEENLKNCIKKVKITHVENGICLGEIIN